MPIFVRPKISNSHILTVSQGALTWVLKGHTLKSNVFVNNRLKDIRYYLKILTDQKESRFNFPSPLPKRMKLTSSLVSYLSKITKIILLSVWGGILVGLQNPVPVVHQIILGVFPLTTSRKSLLLCSIH